jgi:hypothetical protein
MTRGPIWGNRNRTKKSGSEFKILIGTNVSHIQTVFYLQKLPQNQLVVPKTNQEINEPSYEMVGVKITVTNYGQNKSYFWHCMFYLKDYQLQ